MEMSDQDLVKLNVYDSEGSLEARRSRIAATSYGDLVIGPAASKVLETGMMPSPETRPIVGLIVYRAARPEGQTREPSVSVPIANGT